LLDSHDFILLSDDHYIAESYYVKTVSNIPDSLHPAKHVKVVAPIIQEVQNGKILWQWSTINYPEFYSSSVEGNNFKDSITPLDYAHLNSMFVDPKDQNLILSFRNMDEIIKIDRKTGNIIWRLGGPYSDFAETADQKTVRQHHATLADNGSTLLVFDNGDATIRPVTRIVEYHLDEQAKKITSFKAMDVPTKIFTGYMGSVQKTGANYFIDGGSSAYIAEFNQQTGHITFQASLKENSYRGFKY
jgi:hypothetical protein